MFIIFVKEAHYRREDWSVNKTKVTLICDIISCITWKGSNINILFCSLSTPKGNIGIYTLKFYTLSPKLLQIFLAPNRWHVLGCYPQTFVCCLQNYRILIILQDLWQRSEGVLWWAENQTKWNKRQQHGAKSNKFHSSFNSGGHVYLIFCYKALNHICKHVQ